MARLMPELTSSYRDAGVDIDAGNRLVERIKPLAAATARAGALGGLGGFGALFDPAAAGFRRPVLVAATDGVGTKLELAARLARHDTIGIDLVAMCANDILVQGAEPLLFLDYFATGRLDVDVAEAVIRGIARGCEQAGAALVGGETAEMPGMYAEGSYDLAGFCVGAVEAEAIIDGRTVTAGDAVIGIASSGLHSNGYSLVRHVLARSGTALDAPFDGRTLGAALLEPTRIYVRPVLALLRRIAVRAIAHITGGGLVENLPRVLPAGTAARLDPAAWPRPALFDWLARSGGVPEAEMQRTFNLGIGLVLVVAHTDADATLAALAEAGERAWVIGVIEAHTGGARVIFAPAL